MMQEKTIVSFLDILGYEKLVQRMINEDDFVKYFDDLMYDITVNLLASWRNPELEPIVDKLIDAAYFKKIVDTVKVRCIYDNVIFSLPLSDITFSSQEFDKNTTVSHCIEAYFYLLAMFSTLFISKVNHLLRGGISIGPHYEIERNNYLLIFSEAHNRAVRLEKNDTKHPRILLDDSLLVYLEKISYPNIDKFFYKDDDGRYCFDVYSSFSIFNEQKIVQTLTEIKNAVNYHIGKNSEDKDVLSKWIYFAKYHNRKIRTGELNSPDLVVNIDEIMRL
jgi:hypothetical protein